MTSSASNLHQKSIVVNMLESTHSDKYTPQYLEKMRAGGITATNVTTVGLVGINDFSHGIYGIREFTRHFKSMPDRCTIVKKTRDIEEAKKNGKLAFILGLQDLMPIEDNLDHLEVFYELGLRIAQITYNRQTLVGCGCAEPHDSGLSLFGREAVKKINELGLVLDLSHVGERTALDALELSTTPVVFSHSCIKSIKGHFRNVSDVCLKALKEKDGVIGIAAMSIFLTNIEEASRSGSRLEHWLRHVDYVAEKYGVDHVGIGLDVGASRTAEEVAMLNSRFPEFQGEDTPLEHRFNADLNSPEKIPGITEGLLARGYSESDVQKILGLNFMRIFRQVWG